MSVASRKDCLGIKLSKEHVTMADGTGIVVQGPDDSSSLVEAENGVRRKAYLLVKRDSGYISPVTPGVTPDNITPSTSKTKVLYLGDQTGVSRSHSTPVTQHSRASANSSEENIQKVVTSTQNRMPKTRSLQKQLSSPGILEGCHNNVLYNSGMQFFPQVMAQQQQQQQQQFPFASDPLSIFRLAFECRERNFSGWEVCKHPYCVQVRNNWKHTKGCLQGANHGCERCRQFESLTYRHADQCTKEVCPVEMCRSIKYQLRQQFGYLPYNEENFMNPQLHRRNSFGGNVYSISHSDMLHSLSQFETGHIPDDSPTARFIEAKAAEIVQQLDQEEPLLSVDPLISAPPTSLGRPSSLRPANEDPSYQTGVSQGVLSPIVERSEDISSPASAGLQSYIGHSFPSQTTSLSLMSSYEQDGIVKPVEADYPDQKILCKFRTDYLTIGKDSHYYQRRDYNARDIPLGEGGFGAIHPAEDLTSKHLFAIKQNNKDDEGIINSICTEAAMLARLGPHSNVIQMYGAVLDTQELQFCPPRICKLMMELAEHGNLSDMLKDPETEQPSPLESDQALYYFQQLLEGVQFLHKNNVMHLDIKGLNLLIFNEGRTLKICDFGTALRVEEVAASAGKNLGTPQFASPEICRQEEPHFSSDIWSAMCVLVEMLTAMKPWDHRISRDTTHYHLIFMVGLYRDEQMKEDLIPNSETLDPSILDLMGLVFRANHQERPTAMELLTHPLIRDAYTYESCFDELVVDEYYEEQGQLDEEVSYPTHAEAPTSLPLGPPCPPQGTNSDDSHFNPEQKRISTDSGMGIDEDPGSTRGSIQYTRRKYSNKSMGVNSDSGLDTPCTTEKIIFGGKFNFSAFPEENDTDYTDSERDKSLQMHLLTSYDPNPLDKNFHSLPNPDPHSDPIDRVDMIERSFSSTWPNSLSPSVTYSMSSPSGSNETWMQRLPYLCIRNSNLRHSNSAPAVDCPYRRRRLSLQSLQSYGREEVWPGVVPPCGKLRRTCSESNYADKGPEIDSPDRVRKSNSSAHTWTHDNRTNTSQLSSESSQPASNLAISSDKCVELNGIVHQDLTNESTCSSGTNPPREELEDAGIKGSASRVVQEMEESWNEGGKTKVETHGTVQGRTYETYETIC